MSAGMGWHRLSNTSCVCHLLPYSDHPYVVSQNAIHWRTETIGDSVRMERNVNVRMAGVESTAMVRVSASGGNDLVHSSHEIVCKTDDACIGFPLLGQPIGDDERVGNMTCYKGGETIFSNHQMCDVTSTPPRPSLALALIAFQTGRSWTCFLTDRHRSHSVAIRGRTNVISNSGLHKSNLSTVNSRNATRGRSMACRRIRPTTIARRSSVNVCLDASFAERTAVSVRHPRVQT